MKSLFKYVALETFPICLGFSPAREGGSSIVRNRVPSAESSPQSPGQPHARPEQREGSGGSCRDTGAAPPDTEITGCSAPAPPGHLSQAALPSLYIMITGKTAAKDRIFCFSNTDQLKVYQLPGKSIFPSISLAIVIKQHLHYDISYNLPIIIFQNYIPMQVAYPSDLITGDFKARI